MNSKRVYFILLGAVGVLVLVLIGGAYGADTLLQKQSKQLVAQRLQSSTLDAEQVSLAKAKQEITKYKQLANIAQSIVPQDKDQVQAVREIVNIASAAGITLSSITFPGSTLGGVTGAAPASGTSGAATPGASAPSSKLSQLIPVKSIPGVYDLQITVQTDETKAVPYDNFISFLKAMEHNRRTALVSSISLSPSQKTPGYLSFTLVLDEYIKP